MTNEGDEILCCTKGMMNMFALHEKAMCTQHERTEMSTNAEGIQWSNQGTIYTNPAAAANTYKRM
jgi:hypothetical protein